MAPVFPLPLVVDNRTALAVVTDDGPLDAGRPRADVKPLRHQTRRAAHQQQSETKQRPRLRVQPVPEANDVNHTKHSLSPSARAHFHRPLEEFYVTESRLVAGLRCIAALRLFGRHVYSYATSIRSHPDSMAASTIGSQ